MNAGLPGTGIGGLFYLLAGLLLPVIEVYQTLKGRSSLERWRFVLRHTALAWGILFSIEVAAVLIKLVSDPVFTVGALDRAQTQTLYSYILSVVPIATPLMLSFATLSAVILAINLLRMFYGRTGQTERV